MRIKWERSTLCCPQGRRSQNGWNQNIDGADSRLPRLLPPLSHFRHVRLFVTLWTGACHTPLPMEFSSQEYWNGLPCLPPGDLPKPGVKPGIKPGSPALQADSLLWATREALPPLAHHQPIRRMCTCWPRPPHWTLYASSLPVPGWQFRALATYGSLCLAKQ